MLHFSGTNSIKLGLVFIMLVLAAAANASLLDCTKSLGAGLASGAECAPLAPLIDEGKSHVVQEAIPAQPIEAVLAGFQVNHPSTTSALPESAPLLVLIGALLAVVLVRAKSCNTK